MKIGERGKSGSSRRRTTTKPSESKEVGGESKALDSRGLLLLRVRGWTGEKDKTEREEGVMVRGARKRTSKRASIKKRKKKYWDRSADRGGEEKKKRGTCWDWGMGSKLGRVRWNARPEFYA